MSKTQMQDNVWKVKAKALDRYRWLLLRERYSRIGSFLRFVRDAIRDWSFGVCVRCRVSKSFFPLPRDILHPVFVEQ